MEIVVGGHYHLRRRVGAGSFGEVFVGEDVQEHEDVAIKLESVKTRAPQLLYESKLYLLFAGGICVPRLHWFGTEANYNVMVIDYLGKSLEDLFQMCHQRFSLKTVLMTADQCIAALQYIHHKSFIHRDVKPDNFLIGSGDRACQVFVIDFGLSKKYRDPKTLEHMKYATGKSLTGTARYASINALKGFEQSRRDDLESLAYCLLYFMRGSLPWMGLDAKDRKQKYERIRDVKNATTIEELCQDIPEEFAIFLQSVKALDFADEPDYAGYRKLFRTLFIKKEYVYDYQYDWVPLFSRRSHHNSMDAETHHNSREQQNQSNAAHISVRTPEIVPENDDNNEYTDSYMRNQQNNVTANNNNNNNNNNNVNNSNDNVNNLNINNNNRQIALVDTTRTNLSGSTPDTKRKMSPRPPMPKSSNLGLKKNTLPAVPGRTGSSNHLRSSSTAKPGSQKPSSSAALSSPHKTALSQKPRPK